MPALDEFLNATADSRWTLFDSREVKSVEGGVKGPWDRSGFTVNGFYTKLKNIVSQGAVVDPAPGATTWIIVTSPENNSYGAEIELVAYLRLSEGLQLQGSGTLPAGPSSARAQAPISGAGSTASRPRSAISPRPTRSRAAASRSRPTGTRSPTARWTRRSAPRCPSYNYFNFGAGYVIPNTGTRINLDLLNAFQGKGLEEGNPRLLTTGRTPVFFARPILPRRLTLSVDYSFGFAGGGPPLSQ